MGCSASKQLHPHCRQPLHPPEYATSSPAASPLPSTPPVSSHAFASEYISNFHPRSFFTNRGASLSTSSYALHSTLNIRTTTGFPPVLIPPVSNPPVFPYQGLFRISLSSSTRTLTPIALALILSPRAIPIDLDPRHVCTWHDDQAHKAGREGVGEFRGWLR